MIRIGVAGWGYWGSKLTRNLEQTRGATLAAISDPSADRLAEATLSHPAARLFRDSGSLFADPSIDAVVIASPAPTHAELALTALRAGKHVLVEKPFAHSSESALAVIEAGEQRGLVVMVDHTFLYSAPVRTIGRLLAEGTLGRLRRYASLRLNAATVRDDMDVLWDVAPHDMAILDYLLPDRPVSLQVSNVIEDAAGRALQARLTLTYPDTTAQIDVSWIAGQKIREIRLECDGGRLDYKDLDPVTPLRLQRGTGAAASVPVPRGPEPLQAMLAEFVSCVASGERPESDGHMGTRIVRLLEAADQSRREGGALIELEPVEAH